MRANDLEATVLGHLLRVGPCTAYSVRKFFLDSPTSRFSGSAGAIYPLVARLEARGLIASVAVNRGRREARHLTLTGDGLEALREWLLSSTSAEGVDYDPLRTKTLFLSALSAEERLTWFEKAESETMAQLRRLSEHRANYTSRDIYFQLAADNAMAHAKTRLTWLRQSRRALAELQGGRAEGSSTHLD